MEKFQYGQQVTYQVEKILQEFKTSKAEIKYVRTALHGDMLLMNDEIQFSTLDEHRYHNLLVPPNVWYGRSVLILGGGDGLALRNVYRTTSKIERAVVVDWDKEFVEKFSMNYERNEGSLKDPRTLLVYMDALEFLRVIHEKFDTVIIDLPDPDTPDMQELYSKIIRSIPIVMNEYTKIFCHVGPVSLCNKHPNWSFIKKFMYESNYEAELHYRYIPTFSHEWGVAIFNNTDETYAADELEDIRNIYNSV